MTIYAGIYTVLSNLASKVIYVTLPYLHSFTVKDKSVLFASLTSIMTSELSKEESDNLVAKCVDLYSRNSNYFTPKGIKDGNQLYSFIFNDVIQKTVERLEILKAQAGDNVSTDIEEVLIFNNVVDIPTIRPAGAFGELEAIFESTGKFTDQTTTDFYTNAGSYFIHQKFAESISDILTNEIFYFEKYVKFEVNGETALKFGDEIAAAIINRQDINLQGLTNIDYLKSVMDFYYLTPKKFYNTSSPIKSITPGLRLMHINRPNLQQMTTYAQSLFQNNRKALSSLLIHNKAYYLSATLAGKAVPINAIPVVSVEGTKIVVDDHAIDFIPSLDGFPRGIANEYSKTLSELKDKIKETEEYKLFFNYLFPLEKIISMNNAHLVSNLFNIYKEVRSKNSTVKAFDDSLMNSGKALLNESDKPNE